MIETVDILDLVENIRHVKFYVNWILFNMFLKHIYLEKIAQENIATWIEIH